MTRVFAENIGIEPNPISRTRYLAGRPSHHSSLFSILGAWWDSNPPPSVPQTKTLPTKLQTPFVPILGFEPRHYDSKSYTTTSYVIRAFCGRRGNRTPEPFTVSCFQDSVLDQPDSYQILSFVKESNFLNLFCRQASSHLTYETFVLQVGLEPTRALLLTRS